jgi:RNA-directed DNA polymerase
MMMNLLSQYLKRSIESGGVFRDITPRISSGCPLSPIISSFYLYKLDKEIEGKPVYYRHTWMTLLCYHRQDGSYVKQ